MEWYVVEQTVDYVLTPVRMEEIAARVVAEYDKEFNNGKIKELEKRVAKIERDIEKTLDTMVETTSRSARVMLSDRVDLLEAQKNDAAIDLSKLRIANGIRYTREDIVAWIKQFCRGDLMDEDFRRRIIDVFVNSVYLYDDKVVIFYNLKGGKQVSHIDMLDALGRADADSILGSYDKALAPDRRNRTPRSPLRRPFLGR